MSERRHDPDRAAAMLHVLRDVDDDRRIDTLAVVCRAYLDSTPSAWPKRNKSLARFFFAERSDEGMEK